MRGEVVEARGRVGAVGQQRDGGHERAARHCLPQSGKRDDGLAEGEEVARIGAGDAEAGGDAFDVAHLAEEVAELRQAEAVGAEVGDGVLAAANLGGVAKREAEPVAQSAGAHRGDRAVDGGEKRALARAVAGGLFDFQRAERGVVESEKAVGAAGFELEDVLQGGLLRALQILEQGAGGADRRVDGVESEAGEAGDAEVGAEQTIGLVGVKGVRSARRDGGLERGADFIGQRVRAVDGLFESQDFGGSKAGELVEQQSR